MNPTLTLILLIICFFLTSCEKSLQNLNGRDKIYVLSEITSGDSAFVPLGKSAKVGNGENIAFEKLAGATVFVSDAMNPSVQLHWNNSPAFLSNPASIYTDAIIFKANQDYSLQINYHGLPTVNAVTHIPSFFVVSEVLSEDQQLNGKDVLHFSFTINDNASEKNYYVFEAVKQLVKLEEYFYWQSIRYDYNTPDGQQAYQLASAGQNVTILKDTVLTNNYLRLNLYTGDASTDNESFTGSLDSAFHRIFLMDSLFNGGLHATAINVDKTYFESSLPDQKGIVRIRIKSVSKELYDYLASYEKYRSEFGVIPSSSLISPISNIQGGLGIFGGSYKNEFSFYYDQL